MVDSTAVPKKGKDGQGALPTMRVRVRAKNPQIGRKLSDSKPEDETVMHEDLGVGAPAPDPQVSGATEVPVRVGAMMDEDATEIADRPPGLPQVAFIERGRDQTDPSDRVTPLEQAPPRGPGTVRARPPDAAAEPPRPQPQRSEPPRSEPPRSEPAPRRQGRATVKRPKARAPGGQKMAAMPRDRPIMGGTKGAGALAAQVRVQRIEENLPKTSVPALKLLRMNMDAAAIMALDRALTGHREDRDILRASISPKRALERLIHAPPYGALEVADRARLLEPIAAAPDDVDTINSARRLVETGVVGGFGARVRSRLLDLFAALSSDDRVALADLGERSVHGKSALLDNDFEDTSIIEHVAAVACATRVGSALESAGYRKRQSVSNLLAVLSCPAEVAISDGGEGLLAVMEFSLAHASPAEMARLWRGLTLDALSVSLPGEGRLDLGEALRTQPGMVVGGADTPLRLGLEQLAGLAHPRGGPRRSAFIMPGGNCVDADVTARALGYLYGVGFTVAAGASNALRYLEAARPSSTRVPPMFVSLLYEGGERLFVFDRMDDNRAYLRCPRGTSTKPKGSRRLDPVRRVEDPRTALDSVPRDEFDTSVGVALVPRT